MDLCFITPLELEECPIEEISRLIERDDGYLWLDVPEWNDQAARLLSRTFGFHPVALESCRTRNDLPMVHGYADHVFLVLHRPHLVASGHPQLIELDLFVGDRFLVSVHGPVDPSVPPEVPMDEVRETLDRMRARRSWPASPTALMHALVSSIARRQWLVLQDIAGRVADIEGRALAHDLADPESTLDEMFLVRPELLAVGSTASLGREVLARARQLLPRVTAVDLELVVDLEDQLDRVDRMTDRQRDLLAGVIELYRARADTRMMIAGERLARLAAVTLPITAIASVYGMNVIVNERTHTGHLAAVLLLMAIVSGVLLRWIKWPRRTRKPR
jgi:magnesium transporter